MGRPLEFKRRVHLPADTLLEAQPARRLNAAYAALFAWLLLSGATYFTLERWLGAESRGPTRGHSASWRGERAAAGAKYARLPTSAAETQVALALPEPEAAAATESPIAAQSSSELGASPHVLRGGLPEPSADEFIQTFSRTASFDDEPELDDERARVVKRERAAKPNRPRDFDASTIFVGPLSAERPRPRSPVAAVNRPASKAEEHEQTPAQTAGNWPAIEAGASCEGAVAKYREELNLERRNDPPDIGASAYAAVLNDGSYFAHCAVPVSMRVSICAAVQHGRAIGVTVRTAPGSAGAERCIRAAVRRLRFPSHPKLDVTRTDFAPE